MRTIQVKLPSGKHVTLSELTGKEELLAASEVTISDRASSNMLLTRHQILRALKKIDGQQFDPSSHSADSVRDLFSAVDWQLVQEAFFMLNRPSVEDVDAFRTAAEVRYVETPADSGGGE